MGYTGTLPNKTMEEKIEASGRVEVDPHEGRAAYLFLLVFTVLLYARPQDWIPPLAVIPMALIVAAGAGVCYVVSRLQGKLHFTLTTEIKIMAGMTVCFTLGVPFAFWRGNSFDVLTDEWLKTLIIFFLLTQTVISLPRLRRLLWIIILCELLISALSIVMKGDLVMEGGRRMSGITRGMLSGNYLGITVATTFPFIGAFLMRSRSFFRTGILLATFAVSIWMVVLTASRGNMLAVLMAVFLTWLLVFKGNLRARLMGVFLGLLILSSVALAPSMFWDRIRTLWDDSSFATSDPRNSATRSADQSEFQRKALLMRSIEYTFRHPLLGVGLGNFPIVSGSETGFSGDWKGTHNTFTQISTEAGIPAFLLFVSLLYVVIRNMNRIVRESEGNPALAELQLLARATVVSMYAIVFSSFFAHIGYEYHIYFMIGTGVILKNIHSRIQTTPPGLAQAPLRNGNGNGRRSPRP